MERKNVCKMTPAGARSAQQTLRLPKRKDTPKRVFSFWQGMRDSNPRKRSQSPVCYRYTNPLNCRSAETQVLL